MATAKIELRPTEQQLVNLLLDVARYIDESKEIKEKIELRFAGGWVRDKLLGIPSHDMDTAINSMTGLAFGMKMKEYFQVPGNLTKYSLVPADVKNIHTIAANPEKSKHLETTTTKIFGYDVDFVNLRKEIYSEDSRNPQMEFGTAKEDAERRDATINALFYNLHTDLVEDFEGGLKDLESKLIRTPLEPKQTFKDDPLRVLRLIRFASRLDFKIDADCEKWMGNSEITKALKTIISRERIGIELEKMLKGNNPHSSLQYFDKLGLYSTVFTDPTRDAPAPSTANWSVAYDHLLRLRNSKTPGSIYEVLVRSDDSEYLSWILASLSPWSSIPDPPPKKKGGKSDPFGTEVAREGIKLPSKLCDIVTGAFRNRNEITAAKDAVTDKESWVSERDTLGMKIRNWGTNWKLHTLFAILVDRMKDQSVVDVVFMEGWQGFIDHIEKMELMEVATEKLPLTGTALAQSLGNPKLGQWVKKALNVCMEWKLRNPTSRNIDEAIEEVKKRREELGIPPVKDA